MSKDKGLEDRYEVVKRTNPNKQLDCIVLEFDDKIAREAIAFWALKMREHGYECVYQDVKQKLLGITNVSLEPVHFTCPYCQHRYHVKYVGERECNHCERIFTPVIE